MSREHRQAPPCPANSLRKIKKCQIRDDNSDIMRRIVNQKSHLGLRLGGERESPALVSSVTKSATTFELMLSGEGKDVSMDLFQDQRRMCTEERVKVTVALHKLHAPTSVTSQHLNGAEE